MYKFFFKLSITGISIPLFTIKPSNSCCKSIISDFVATQCLAIVVSASVVLMNIEKITANKHAGKSSYNNFSGVGFTPFFRRTCRTTCIPLIICFTSLYKRPNLKLSQPNPYKALAIFVTNAT